MENKYEPDKILVFDIKGPFAHFRKYYTNSSSLTYSFPPRTVITGLIAGILGYANEKPTSNKRKEIYYEKFGGSSCKIAISLKTKIRKVTQTINYIKTKTDQQSRYSFKDLILGTRGAPTQIPLEIILSAEENNTEIAYRIYFHHRDEDNIYMRLKERLQGKRYVYPPYLGITECLASIDYVAEGRLQKNINQQIEINTISKLEEVEPDFNSGDLQYLIEKMPTGFSNKRIPLKPTDYIFEMRNRYMKVQLKSNAASYSVCYPDNGCTIIENIIFM